MWLHEYLRDFEGKQDVLRYVLTANAPETKDNDFTWADFQQRNNSELVAILGNFVNRVLVLTHKYYGGVVPVPNTVTDAENNLFAELKEIKARQCEYIDTFHFREALKEAMNIARLGNRYLQETEPWKLAKTDMERVATVMNAAIQLCANIAIAFEPFLPFMSQKLAGTLHMDSMTWDQLGNNDLIAAGTEIGAAQLLFEKIEDDAIQAQLDRLARIKEENKINQWKPAPVQEATDFDTFMKMDIRVGTVMECSRVPKADKLLQFKIDDGMGGRTIVSGIAKYYDPADLVGKQVCFIANFPPRRLKGIESQGMILSAENADGQLIVVGPTGPVTPGAQVK